MLLELSKDRASLPPACSLDEGQVLLGGGPKGQTSICQSSSTFCCCRPSALLCLAWRETRPLLCAGGPALLCPPSVLSRAAREPFLLC